MKKAEKKSDPKSDKMQAAVEAAWGKAQDDKFKGAAFGKDQKGHAYRAVVAPVVRDLCKAQGLDCGPATMPQVRQSLCDWEPENSHWERVKQLLVCCCDELTDAMSDIGADTLEDDFLVKAPDLAKSRRDEEAKAPKTV